MQKEGQIKMCGSIQCECSMQMFKASVLSMLHLFRGKVCGRRGQSEALSLEGAVTSSS